MGKKPRPLRMGGGCTVTREGDPAFWSQCQRAALLALEERGILSREQCLRGEELLREQGRGRPGTGGGR